MLRSKRKETMTGKWSQCWGIRTSRSCMRSKRKSRRSIGWSSRWKRTSEIRRRQRTRLKSFKGLEIARLARTGSPMTINMFFWCKETKGSSLWLSRKTPCWEKRSSKCEIPLSSSTCGLIDRSSAKMWKIQVNLQGPTLISFTSTIICSSKRKAWLRNFRNF